MPRDLLEIVQSSDVTVLRAGLVDIDASFVVMLLLFLFTYQVMKKMLLVPMRNMFDQRHALTDGAREDAASAVERAEKRISEYEGRIAEARRKAIAETKAIRADASTDERALIDAVREETQATVDKGMADLQSQAAKANAGLESTAASLGEKIAGQVLGGVA